MRCVAVAVASLLVAGACTRKTEGYCDQSTPCGAGQTCNARTRLCESTDGGADADQTSASFELVQSIPVAGSDQPPRADIVLTFNHAVDANTAADGIALDVSGAQSAPTITVDGSVVHVAPPGGLVRGASYVLNATSALHDTDGNGLAQPLELSFTVVDSPWSSTALLTDQAVCGDVAVATSEALGAIVVWRESTGIVRGRRAELGGWSAAQTLGSPATSAPQLSAGLDHAACVWADGQTVGGASLKASETTWQPIGAKLGSGNASVDPQPRVAVGADGVASIALVRKPLSVLELAVQRGVSAASSETLDSAAQLTLFDMAADLYGNVAVIWSREDFNTTTAAVAAATYSATDDKWTSHGARTATPLADQGNARVVADNALSGGSFVTLFTEIGAAPRQVFVNVLSHDGGWLEGDSTVQADAPALGLAASIGRALVAWRDDASGTLYQRAHGSGSWEGVSELGVVLASEPLIAADAARVFYGLWTGQAGQPANLLTLPEAEWLGTTQVGSAAPAGAWLSVSPSGVGVAVVARDAGGGRCQLYATFRR